MPYRSVTKERRIKRESCRSPGRRCQAGNQTDNDKRKEGRVRTGTDRSTCVRYYVFVSILSYAAYSDDSKLRFLSFLIYQNKISGNGAVPVFKNIIAQKAENEKKGKGENNCGKREKTSDIWQRSVIR